MNPREYLLYLRKKQQDIIGYVPKTETLRKPDSWYEVISPELDEYLERNYRLKAEEFGSYDDVILTEFKEIIEETSPECCKAEFAVGELFLSYPQAKIIRYGPNQYVIALHTHLLHFLRFIVITSLIRLRLDMGMPTRLSRQELYPWFDSYIKFFFLRQGNEPSIPANIDKQEMVMEEFTYIAGVLWILGHEYGHFLLGHLENHANFSASKICQEAIQVFSLPSHDKSGWAQEFAADAIGVDLVTRAFEHERFYYTRLKDMDKRDKPGYIAWGVDNAMAMLALVDRRYILYGAPRYKLGSHPPAHLRLQSIMKKNPSLFVENPICTSIVTGYFDWIYRQLPGTHEIRKP